MYKKNIIVISVLLIMAIVCSIFVFKVRPHSNSSNQVGDIKVTPTAENLPSETGKTEAQESTTGKSEIIVTEDVMVTNNFPEIDLKAELYENPYHETFLKLMFKIDGLDVEKELDSDKIPELKDIFEKRGQAAGSIKGNTVRRIILNPKYKKAYIMVEGNPEENGVGTAVFVYNLKDFSFMKLAAEVGEFTDMVFSEDTNYMAFSYSEGQEGKNPFLDVVSCETDRLKVSKNKYENDAPIGNYKNLKCYYGFIKWFSNSIIELNETSYTMSTRGIVQDSKKQRTVLYNIEKNAFVNPDGSLEGQNGSGAKQTGVKQTGVPMPTAVLGNSPTDAIKRFYVYISGEQYKKAYDMLDESFRFSAFKGIGIPGFKKSEIAEKDFPKYGNILKGTNFNSVVLENITGDTSKVYFYITLTGGRDVDVKSPLAATLKRINKQWKIVSVDDGNMLEPPFN